MKIFFDSELMENHKAAVVMAPDKAFEVLQSQDGDALFFSIGTDGVCYLTREVTETSTGWNRIDLSSALSVQNDGAQVTAKAFAVTQNVQTLAVDIALVVTVGGADGLYLSIGNANTDAAWADGVTWTAVPFDAGTAPDPLVIADVSIMNIPGPGGSGAVENIFVDILRRPDSPLLDRYYITPGTSPQWKPHKLAADLAAGSIANCLGQRPNDPTTGFHVPGIYTFGTISDETQLLFTPQYNYFRPTNPPDPARLMPPSGATAIASALNGSGVTNLFVAATDGLYVFAPDNQYDRATPVQIVANSLFAGAGTLAAATDAKRTAVWGLGPQGTLCYVSCPAGSEADPAAWSTPVPLVPDAEQFAFFLNVGAGTSVLFADVDGQDLVRLTQDPVTTDWLQRSVLLPATVPDDVITCNSFTTHVTVTDDSGLAAPNTAVAVTATSPVSIYLNDVYHLLSTTVPVNTTTDATGVLTVVQETQSLAAVCFRVVLTDAPDVVAEVNPMSNATATLETVQTGDDLRAVMVTDADGTRQPLVPSGISTADSDAAAQAIAQFMKINAGLPQDGSRQTSGDSATSKARAGRTPQLWGLSFAGGGLAYHEGAGAVEHLAPGESGEAPLGIGSDISVAMGDFFSWLRDGFEDVEKFVVQEAEGIYHFVATIAGKVYDVLLDCVAAVVHAVEFVLNKIMVFFEDLIKWLGFLFVWSDIVRTHNVLKNLFTQYLVKCVDGLDGAETQVRNVFAQVQGYVDTWAGLPDDIPASLGGTSRSSAMAAATPMPGQNSPQSNWGLFQLKSNAANGTTTAQPNQGVTGDVTATLQPLVDALSREKDILELALQSFRTDVIDKIDQLTFTQLLEEAIAINIDALLQSVENVLIAAINVLAELVEGCMEILNATLEIPVLSWMYKKVSGNDLSLLDAACLVAAIPVTLGYKLVADAAPFPDDATTTALIDAPDFATIRRLCASTPAPSTRPVSGQAQKSVDDVMALTGGVGSLIGAVSLSIFQPLAKKFRDSEVFPIINGPSYLLYVTPDIVGQLAEPKNPQWWDITNQVLGDLMTVKAVVDMCVGSTEEGSAADKVWGPVTPYLDAAANLVWNAPTLGAFACSEGDTIDELNVWGGTCFNLNGMMSPVLADDEDPVSWGIAVGVATVLNLAYGSMSCASSALMFKS
ncbi:hypothetical protein ACIBQ6_03365 [Nonomuraea sp. NPDC049655]|uniref:hypothetical protein n=1 Tax=Nonomuraea sp. NPDC049655 TaxID=3364355 RepID=UPI00378AD119